MQEDDPAPGDETSPPAAGEGPAANHDPGAIADPGAVTDPTEAAADPAAIDTVVREEAPDRLAQPVGDEAGPRLPFAVVGVGASAGGLDAYTEFLQACAPAAGIAYVLIQHLSPKHTSIMAELLQKSTEMPVHQVEDAMRVEPDHVYVIRPGFTMTIREGHLHLGEAASEPMHRRPIDDFFKSLAEEQRERAIAVILSGTGSNGTVGCESVKAVGGICLAQDPESAAFPSMPRSLIDANLADAVLRPGEMFAAIRRYAGHPYARGDDRSPDAAARRERQAMNEVIAILRTRTRHDFGVYKKPTLVRRIQRRMSLIQAGSMAEYARALRQAPNEVAALADDLMIHVTGFFRDPHVWDALRDRVIRPMVAEKPDEATIRCWVTACSSGEEAYTIGMLLLEAAEAAGKRFDIKIFATDTAERSLTQARAGVFPGGIEGEVAPSRLARFFDKDDAFYRVKRELRELVVFAPQNVLQDQPFSRLDLCTCRNLLIYIEPETQRRILSVLHFGLREGGALVLGTSETIAGADDLFEPIDKQHRIYRRLGPTRHGMLEFPVPPVQISPRAAAQLAGQGGEDEPRPLSRATVAQLATKMLLEHHTPATVVVDRSGQIVYYHGNTERFLKQPTGEPTRDLLTLAREEVRGGLRSVLQRVQSAGGDTVHHRDGTLGTGDGRERLWISAAPLGGHAGQPYLLVSFETQQDPQYAPGEAPAIGGADEHLADELRRVRDELQSTIEELQTSNEEMKASHEEVTSINEELQSSNEELETSKEELQSLNEELTTVNAQLQAKMEELERTSSDLSSLLASTDIAVIFLDAQLRIRRFTPALKKLMDLIPSDVGRPLADLARRFDDPALADDARAVLERLVPREATVAAGDGRWYDRRVLPYRTAENRIDGVVVTFVDITERRTAEREATEAKEFAESIVETLHEPLLVLRPDLTVARANAAFYEQFQVRRAETAGRKVYQLGNGQWDIPALRRLLENVLPNDHVFTDYEVAHDFESIGRRVMLLNGRRLDDAQLILLGIRDVTDARQSTEALREGEERYRAIVQGVADQAIFTLDLAGNIDSWNPGAEQTLGFSADDAIGQPSGLIFTPEDRAAGADRHEMETALADGRAVDERWHLRKDGSRLWGSGSLTVLRHADGTPRGFVKMLRDQTARRRAEESLRASERRQAFLLELTDAVRPLGDPTEIQAQASRTLGRALGADRVFYAEVADEGRTAAIAHDWHSPALASVAGRHGLAAFGRDASDALHAGRNVIYPDVAALSALTPDERGAYAALGIAAQVNVPLLKGGRLTAFLAVHQAAPREWRPDEVSLIEETAERTWAAVEQAKAEAALRVSEAQNAAVFAHATVGLAELDLAGRFVRANDTMCATLGRPCASLLGVPAMEMTHAEDVPLLRDAVAHVVATGGRRSFDTRQLRGDGALAYVNVGLSRLDDDHGRPRALLAVTVDLTARREAEEEARAGERLYRAIAANLPNGAVFIVDREMRYQLAEGPALRAVGLKPVDFEGKTIAEAVSVEQATRYVPQYRAALAGEPFTAEHAERGRHFVSHGAPLRDDAGQVYAVLVVSYDITERKQAALDMAAAKETAEAASRTKDEFLATLSHELRTPLSAILIWSRLMASPSATPADMAEGLDAIARSAEAQKRLIDDLLDSARIASGKLRLDLVPTEIGPLVAEAVEAVRPTAEAKGIAVATDLAADAGMIMVDPGRVRQIVWNLLNNAVKFTDAGGRIDVRLWRAGGHLRVRIADTGRGIDAAFLPHVFERFKQAEVGATRTAGGLGLGLAIVKQLVEMHNGRIAADSEGLGKGAAFTVELPLPSARLARRGRVAAQTRDAQAAAAADDGRSLAGLRVLIVEDQPDTRRATRMLLEAADVTVVEAADAAEAEALYAADRPDVLISDIGLPGDDGRTLLGRLRAADGARPRVPAIALTAFAQDSERAATLAAGFDAVVVKPFQPEALLMAIANALPPADG